MLLKAYCPPRFAMLRVFHLPASPSCWIRAKPRPVTSSWTRAAAQQGSRGAGGWMVVKGLIAGSPGGISSGQICTPEYFNVTKSCIVKALEQMVPDGSEVEGAGSLFKGTYVHGISDWDYYISMGQVTVNKSLLEDFVHALMKEFRIRDISFRDYEFKSEYTVRLKEVLADRAHPLPNIDITFEDHQGNSKYPPNNGSLGDCDASRRVVKFIKAMPYPSSDGRGGRGYIHLDSIKGMYVEDYVMLVAKGLRPDQDTLRGEPGSLDADSQRLLIVALEKIRDEKMMTDKEYKKFYVAGRPAKTGMTREMKADWAEAAACEHDYVLNYGFDWSLFNS